MSDTVENLPAAGRHLIRHARQLIPWLFALYAAASLVHFTHNAEYLAQYPNLPASWTPRWSTWHGAASRRSVCSALCSTAPGVIASASPCWPSMAGWVLLVYFITPARPSL